MASRVLLIGYGNPGRRDDGLGPAIAQQVEALNIPHVTVDIDYQLTVEHAYDLAEFDTVIFADATLLTDEAFYFRLLEPGAPLTFTTHSITPGGVIRIARDLFHAETTAYVLGIRGYEFDIIAEGFSDQAKNNLEKAFQFLRQFLDPS